MGTLIASGSLEDATSGVGLQRGLDSEQISDMTRDWNRPREPIVHLRVSAEIHSTPPLNQAVVHATVTPWHDHAMTTDNLNDLT
jgi:hypothetical protein